MFKNIQKNLEKQKKLLKNSIKTKPEEKIGKFNLFLFGSIALIAIFSIDQINAQKIVKLGLKKSLPNYEITDSVFVNKNSLKENKDGSPSDPFKELSFALNLIKIDPEIKNIYLAPGRYEGVLEIPQGINLYAFKPKTFIINASSGDKTLLLKGNNILRGLTIQGGRYAIYIPEEAQSIKIENCKIENASWYGIYNKEHPEVNDQYKLEIINSEITKNNLQGLYLQKGTFIMKDSKSIKNGEEGIDLHIGMNSTITNSVISDNGEGGIETELGNINLIVENCTINNNGSSGINLQSNSDNSTVRIKNNSISNNTDFGIRCALHSKILPKYFANSFETYPAKINQFSDNGKTAIDPNCWKY